MTPLVLWSAPRCRSTMFLRMMAARGDFRTVHEPFSRVKDFGTAQVLDETCTGAGEVIAAVLRRGREGPLFVKDTTDFHYPEVLGSAEFLTGARHTFIVRDPADAIASHFGLNPRLERDEIGFAWLREIFDAVAAATGVPPVVVDADDLVRDPAGVVGSYCSAVGIPFRPDALSWPAGALPEWGTTARWHVDVAGSEGIEAHRSSRPRIDVREHPVLGGYYRFHLPHFRALWEHRLTR